MKIIMVFFLVLYSLTGFAERMVISGRPIILDMHRGFFTLPPHSVERKGYLFVSLIQHNRVCFLNQKPEFSSLDMIAIIIEDAGLKLRWHCYRYNSKFFELDF